MVSRGTPALSHDSGSVLPFSTANDSDQLILNWADISGSGPAALQDPTLASDIASSLTDPPLFGQWASPPTSAIGRQSRPPPGTHDRRSSEWDAALGGERFHGSLENGLPDLVMSDASQSNEDRMGQDISAGSSLFSNDLSNQVSRSHSSSRSSLQLVREAGQLKSAQGNPVKMRLRLSQQRAATC